MQRRIVTLFVLCLTTVASGQDDPQQIRQKIADLQQQLEAAESAPPKRNVTQIGAARTRKVETGMVVRIYDLGDLFAVAPPYPAMLESDLAPQARQAFGATEFMLGGGKGGGGMGGGGGFFSVTPGVRAAVTATTNLATTVASQAGTAGTVKSSQDEMIQVIRETIKPEIWKEGAKITKLGNAFVISADEDAHEQIEALLNLFRARWGTLRTVSVRAWWISLAPAELRTLLDTPTEKVAPDGPPVFGVVAEKTWNDLLQIWEQPKGDGHRLRYQATLTCYNGQTVSTVSGTQDLAVSGMNVVVPQDEGVKGSQVGYHPELTLIQQGLAFQITPVTNTSGKTVLLDIHSRLSLPTSGEGVEAEKKRQAQTVFPQDVVHPIDRRRLNIHRLSTTARVPVDRPYLVGGMSLPSAETEGLQLYLFVKISVQELRNDQPAAGDAVDEKEVKGKVEK